VSPTILRHKNYRFFSFSREEERMHVHISSADGEAKFWLEPVVALADYEGLSKKQLTAFPADFDRLSLAHFPHICGALPLNRSTIRGQRASNVRKMLYAITYQNQRETLYLALRIINYSLGARNLI